MRLRTIVVGCVLASLTACKRPPQAWQDRPGPGFVVSAPTAPRELHHPAGGGDLTVFEYSDDDLGAMQVQLADVPPGRAPLQVIMDVRDNAATKYTITSEQNIAMGDAPGKDLRYEVELASGQGKRALHQRILIQNHHLFQIMVVHPIGDAAFAAKGDRFIQSFKLTAPPGDPLADLQARAGSGSDAPHMEIHRAGAGSADATGWYAAHSEAGRFSVRFPAPFSDMSMTEGSASPIHLLVALRAADSMKFVVSCSPPPGGKTPAELVHTFAAGIDGVTSSRELVVQGHAAIDVFAGTHARMRAIALADRICMMAVEPMSKLAAVPEPDAQTMFDSFSAD